MSWVCCNSTSSTCLAAKKQCKVCAHRLQSQNSNNTIRSHIWQLYISFPIWLLSLCLCSLSLYPRPTSFPSFSLSCLLSLSCSLYVSEYLSLSPSHSLSLHPRRCQGNSVLWRQLVRAHLSSCWPALSCPHPFRLHSLLLFSVIRYTKNTEEPNCHIVYPKQSCSTSGNGIFQSGPVPSLCLWVSI